MGRQLFASWILASCVGAVLLAGHSATFVLRDGNRVSGELSYKGGTAYTLNGRDYPSDDIAVIEFVPGDPSAAELAQVPAVDNNPSEHERHVFVTRDGNVMLGKIYQISPDGNTITFDKREGGRQEVSADQLARVYVNPAGARSVYSRTAAAAVGTSGTATGAGRTVTVNAAQRWTDTGIDVAAGDRVAFEATGEIQYGRTAGMTATPNGNGAPAPNLPLPSAPVGALIGRIGTNGAPFGIGTQTQALGMPAAGRLFLGVNDNQPEDNAGAFTVTIRR